MPTVHINDSALVTADGTQTLTNKTFVAPVLGAATGTSLALTGAFGCNGNSAQTKATVNAASTDLATVVALCNQLRAALVANGIAV